MNGLLEIMYPYPSIVGSVKQQQQQQQIQQQQQQLQNSTNTSSSSMLTNTNNESSMMMMATEHGEMEEASSGGTSVSEWRPAPYRCGHCHQVSNWKHVIQVFTNTWLLNISFFLRFFFEFLNFCAFFGFNCF